ncbi:hypothetical protein V500_10708, partial [Pseudogymnoascus sp. VKM F-4518 (FW-2643)]
AAVAIRNVRFGAVNTAQEYMSISLRSEAGQHNTTVDTDQYAFGYITYATMTGIYMFHEVDAEEIVRQHKHQEWPDFT